MVSLLSLSAVDHVTGGVKPKSMKLVFTSTPLSTQHKGVRVQGSVVELVIKLII